MVTIAGTQASGLCYWLDVVFMSFSLPGTAGCVPHVVQIKKKL